ncbi:AI-2E family transporter [Pseudoclavibacter helvolus]|uniref:AI-2E family transporter n=1 Tax=Pseudoclavibacter helvolus TaxID=255205 RepID=UPI0024AE3034|nr:AI-2E family transporter [Pseudoclavibacter helvolus]
MTESDLDEVAAKAASPRTGSTLAQNPTPAQRNESEDELVPRGLRIGAAWAWRSVAILLALIPLGWLVAQASILVIPLLVAALLASLLAPLMKWLVGSGLPRWAALILSLIVLLVAIGTLITLVISQFAQGFNLDLGKLEAQYQLALQFLADSPLHVTEQQVDDGLGQLVGWVQSNVNSIASQALSVGSNVAAFLAGTLVTAFALIFYLLDGRSIWLFIVSIFPKSARAAIDGAGQRGWISVGHYVRVQVLVALIDAVGIYLGAVILQVPFALPIGVIVFLASFVPYIGAISAGTIAVAVALAYNGFLNALIMLIVVVAVMQIESHILQPLIMGSAVKLHPLVVLLSVSAGTIFGGIAGAVFAVPLVAAGKVMVQFIARGTWRDEPDPTKITQPPKSKREKSLREQKASTV